MGVRVHGEEVPGSVRAALEARVGAPIVEAITQPQGFSPGLAARLRLDDGRRVFVKAVSEAANPDTPDIHRREARILAALPASAHAPRLLWTFDEQGWVALCLEDIDGRHPHEPWTEDDLNLVVETFTRMAADLTPSPIAVDETASQGFARNINGWQEALPRGEGRLDLSRVHKDELDAVVCTLAGYFVVRALEPPPPGIPTVRAFQAAQGRVTIAWLRERTGWD